MNDTPEIEIEQIVRQVLAELGVAPADGPAPAAETAAASPTAAAGQVTLTGRVVTMKEVGGRLGTARRLVVSRDAVVTPAVQDELRRRRVTLVRAAPEESRPSVVGRLVLVAARTRRDPAALVRALGQEGIRLEQHAADCLIVATDQLAAEVVKPETLGLLWTGHTAIGLCLANRHPGVRAVLATDAAATAAARAAVGANLLVLDPAAGTPFQQKQIVGEFCRGGGGACPEALCKRLG